MAGRNRPSRKLDSATNQQDREDERESLKPDIVVTRDASGDFHLVQAKSDRGRSWIRRNIPSPALTPEGELMIGPDYLPDLLVWMREDGLRVTMTC